MLETDARLALIQDWLTSALRLKVRAVEPASSDASFRRYFRAFTEGATYIVMDAPADKEDVRPYLKVTALLEPLGVHVPHVHAQDVARGLLLLEDLGTTPYLARLAAGDDPEPLYADALAALVKIQVGGAQASTALAPYGRAELDARDGADAGVVPGAAPGAHAHGRGSAAAAVDVRVPHARGAGAAGRCSCTATTTRAT